MTHRRPASASLTLIFGLAGCTAAATTETPLAPEPPAIHVVTVAVAARLMPQELPVTGQLVAPLESDVAANATGRVQKTFVDHGSVVKAGDILAQLDLSTAAISQAQAQASLQVAVTSQELADTLCKRNQELLDKGAIAKEEWERTNSQCKSSAASAEVARAQVAMVAKNIVDGVVRAPFAGVVTERYVSVGEYVQPPSRVVKLVSPDPLRLQVTLAEVDLSRVTKGQEVTFNVQAFPGRTFKGTVQYISPTVRSTSLDTVVEAVVPNGDLALKPGMFAVAHLHLPDAPQPVVPATALASLGAATHAFVVINKHLEERVVQRGQERDGFVAILDGVHIGEQVVSTLTDAVRDGVPVQ